MLERIPGVQTFKRNGPAIETAAGSVVVVAGSALYTVPEDKRDEFFETTDRSPIGFDNLLDNTQKIGAPDQAILLTLTFIGGVLALHGVSRLDRKKT